MSKMSIYMTNLGKYNEGFLIGEWVKLPIDEEELQDVFRRIGINERYEEWFITDYEVEIHGIGNVIGEYSNFQTLNEIAVKLETLQDWEQEKLEAILEAESTSSLSEIMEHIENLDDWDLLVDVKTNEDLGYYCAEECCCLEIPESIKRYFDYESYGRDIGFEGNGTFTSRGYLVQNN